MEHGGTEPAMIAIMSEKNKKGESSGVKGWTLSKHVRKRHDTDELINSHKGAQVACEAVRAVGGMRRNRPIMKA